MKNLFELIMTTATKSDELKQFSRLQVRILVLLFYAGFDTLHPDISVKILHTVPYTVTKKLTRSILFNNQKLLKLRIIFLVLIALFLIWWWLVTLRG